MTLRFVLASLLFTVPTLALAQSQPRGPLAPEGVLDLERVTAADRILVEEAARAHRAELRFAELAASRARNVSVRQLASHLRHQHEQELSLLERLAAGLGIALPEMTDLQRQTADRLVALEGARFDSAFITQVLNGHHDQLEFYTDMTLSPTLELRLYGERRRKSLLEHHRRAQVLWPIWTYSRWSPDRIR